MDADTFFWYSNLTFTDEKLEYAPLSDPLKIAFDINESKDLSIYEIYYYSDIIIAE